MDVFPSLMEYLRIPIEDEWSIDGKSRIQWEEEKTETEQCDLTKEKTIITLNGGYLLEGASREERNVVTD